MTVIKAPYNFVPFNKEVVTPHWIDQISHDIPFKDGLSGKIEVKLTAMSPIFVRDGIGQAASAKNYEGGVQQQAHTFSQAPDGRYFIPGTSLKGMIRSVLEILSFGSMENKVNDHRYALRDLSGAMQGQYLAQFKPDKIHCGWLKKNEDNSYSIRDCGIPGRIGHDEIDRHFKTNFVSFFGLGGQFNAKRDTDKAARKKYALFGTNLRTQRFTPTSFPPGVIDGGRKLYRIDSGGSKKGMIVFTGQPGVRKKDKKGKWTGHFYEFIFFEGEETPRPVDEKVMETFFFAYHEHDPAKRSEDWKVWRSKLEEDKEEIPVFFHLDKDNKVTQLGLSYLYKLPYTYSVLESINQHQGKERPDISEAIFGHIINGKEQLRGRVHIGHAFSSKNAKPTDHEVKEVLSGPKASYFPTYIRQAVKADGTVKAYSTFMDEGAEIAGWKRYPVHTSGVTHNDPPDRTDSEKILTKFRPLQAGAEFVFALRYHNLRPMELGALISALTFHDTTDAYHSIGMAKPLGYGKLKVEILNVNEGKRKEYLRDFEAYMNAQPNMPYGIRWNEATQVVELITMAQAHDGAKLTYMPLEDHMLAKNNKDKDFKPKSYEALAPYSQLVKDKATVPTYCDPESVEKMRRLIREEMVTSRTSDNIEEVVAHTKEAKKAEVQQSFAKWKQLLLDRVAAKKEEIAQEERLRQVKKREEEAAQRKAEEQEKARSEGLSLSGINLSRRDAFADASKRVEEYARKRLGATKSELEKQYAGQYLALSDHEELLKALRTIFYDLNKNDRARWLEPFEKNHPMRKVAEWIGEEKAREFLKTLQS